jgi:hypothetical protein
MRHPEIEAYLNGELGDDHDVEPDSTRSLAMWPYEERPMCTLHEDCREHPDLARACAEDTHPEVNAWLAGKLPRASHTNEECPCCRDWEYEHLREEQEALKEALKEMKEGLL